MAKGNLFLGHARGKVGSVVFSRQDGEQVTRALNTRPKNPQTDQQIVQRAIAGTVMYAYSYLQEICNHSFEGIAYGAKSQQYFTKVNMDLLRQLYAANPTNTNLMMFSKKNSKSAVANAYIISKGSISNTPIQPKLVEEEGASVPTLGKIEFPPLADISELKVSQYLAAIGLTKAKDQMTLIMIRPEFDVIGKAYDDSLKNQYKLQTLQIDRAIRTEYSPEDVSFSADGSNNQKFFDELAKCLEIKKNSGAIGLDGLLDPNLNKKEGLQINTGGVLAAGIIYSSYDNVKGWLRSNSQLVCTNSLVGGNDHFGLSAGNLIDYWDDSASVVESKRLLNNGNA